MANPMPGQTPLQVPARTQSVSRFLGRVGLLIAGLGLVLGAMELGVRVVARIAGPAGYRLAARDPLSTIYEPFGNYGYRPTPGKVERFGNGTQAHYNEMGYRGPLVGARKPPGAVRIVLLGGSAMAGYGVSDDQTIDAYMRRLVTDQHPGRCVEVVNLALGGYDSYQDFERLRVDGLKLAPDIVVLHVGINDVRNARFEDLGPPPDPRTLIWERQMQQLRVAARDGHSWWTLAKHYSFLARIPGFAAELWQRGEELQLIHDVGPFDGAIEYFDDNVTSTIALARDAGITIVLSSAPSALPVRNRPGDPVEKSYWIKDAGTTEAYRARLALRLQEIAQRHSEAGVLVPYLSHTITLGDFIDDAHLAPDGNEAVARNILAAVAPQLDEMFAAGRGVCSAD